MNITTRVQTVNENTAPTHSERFARTSTAIHARSFFRRFMLLALVGLTCLAGCSQYIDPDVPEPIIPGVEPEHAGKYLLYRPSRYDRRDNWPLIVVCHGSFPDSANKRIRDWTQLAERKGVILVAPELDASAFQWSGSADKQMAKLRADEQRILAIVRHVRAGHSISPDRMFIHGWSSGAYAALYTGLKNPDIFRAVAVSRPKFDERYVEELAPLIDPYQCVCVHHHLGDTITGKNARRCVSWLRDHNVDLVEDGHGDAAADDTEQPIGFFEDVIGRSPWMRIHALPASANDPLAVQFKLRYANQSRDVRWDFGDGQTSRGQEPRHTYGAPGKYTIVVVATDANGKQHRRAVVLAVPELSISTIASAKRDEDQENKPIE